MLSSTDLTLFSGDKLPTVLPALERFDAARGISFHYDFLQSYWGLAAHIETLLPGAESTMVPVLFDLERDASGMSFGFWTEPSKPYVVEFTEDLRNWTTLTNVAPTMQRTRAAINDSSAVSAPRFYRVRTE
jgi:hypothetical protein